MPASSSANAGLASARSDFGARLAVADGDEVAPRVGREDDAVLVDLGQRVNEVLGGGRVVRRERLLEFARVLHERERELGVGRDSSISAVNAPLTWPTRRAACSRRVDSASCARIAAPTSAGATGDDQGDQLCPDGPHWPARLPFSTAAAVAKFVARAREFRARGAKRSWYSRRP